MRARNEVRVLATQMYIAHARQKYSDFSRRAFPDRDASSQVAKWASGEKQLTERSVSKIEMRAPGTAIVWAHPLFRLLDPACSSARRIKKELARYQCTFTDSRSGIDAETAELEDRLDQASSVDAEFALVARGDLDGLAIVLGQFRLYNADKKADAKVKAFLAAYLIQGLALLAQTAWAKAFVLKLVHCVLRILEKDSWASPGFKIDWRAFNALASVSTYNEWYDSVTERDGEMNPIVFYDIRLGRDVTLRSRRFRMRKCGPHLHIKWMPCDR